MYKQILPFAIVTISGSLLVLNLVYVVALKLINNHENLVILLSKDLFGVVLSKNFVDINLSTVIGVIASVIWNYNGYKFFVFSGVKLADGAESNAPETA